VTATAPTSDPSDYARVASWLRENLVPPAPGPAWTEWCAGAATLGADAIDILVDLLQEGDCNLQYGALMALRQLGVEAWAHGYEPNLHYEVTVPGREPQKIVPRLQAAR
jgi:hypothetical protein